MASRTRRQWKPDRNGQFTRQIGWNTSRNGNRAQPKFRLGSDVKMAKQREAILQQLWTSVERTSGDRSALWTDSTLAMAKQIAKGESVTCPKLTGELDEDYAIRIGRLREDLPLVQFVPDDEAEYRRGAFLVRGLAVGGLIGMNDFAQKVYGPFLKLVDASPYQPGAMLHEAMREHIAWLRKEYQDAQHGVTAWGRTRIKQTKTLVDRHADVPLSTLNRSAIEEMIRYWRERPDKKKRTKEEDERPISKNTSENLIYSLREFFRWLDDAEGYKWQLPKGFDRIKTRVNSLADERRSQVTGEDVFTLDELILLGKYATPLERFLVLLGLNCGFGRAEIATLRVGEVHLREVHEERLQRVLGYSTSKEDSFIRRCRPKTGVLGVFLLFPLTTQAIEWALKRRKRQPGFEPEARLLLNDKGEAYDRPTKSGNPNQQIPNRFKDLICRVREDNNEIRSLPVSKLRKTAGDLVRQFSDGETASVFLMHGRPFEQDDLLDQYTRRPFGNVFEAIRKVQDHLQPVFDAAGPTPFDPPPQSYTHRSTIDRIHQLHEVGMPVEKIAKEVKKHPATVYRHIRRLEAAQG